MNAFAIFCPNSFNSINIGDSIDQVIQVCGVPTSRNEYKKTPSVPQEWIYYFQTPGFHQGNVKLSVTFNENDQVINIDLVNNTKFNPLCMNANISPFYVSNCQPFQQSQNLSQTNLCGGMIRLGDTKNTVEYNCGKPSFVNQSEQQNTQGSTITELTYTGAQTITLQFENGLLVNRGVN